MGEPLRHWSTDRARPGEALSYWVEAICEGFLEMKADSPSPADFSASITQHPFGPIELNFADTTGQEVWRTPQAIAGSRKHTFYLLYMREGRLGAHQRGRDADLQTGDCVLIDSMEPYSFSFPDTNRCLSVQMPRDWLRNWIPEPERILATPFAANSGWGRTLASAAGNLAECDYDRLALPRGVVADQLGAFADAGTSFGATLMELRLNRARELLDDRRLVRVGIAEIAWRCGFREPSHFARRFRARYGAAPGDYRTTLHA
jgi:AraC family transcriptional regulator, positive regulator of tynA and feaB